MPELWKFDPLVHGAKTQVTGDARWRGSLVELCALRSLSGRAGVGVRVWSKLGCLWGSMRQGLFYTFFFFYFGREAWKLTESRLMQRNSMAGHIFFLLGNADPKLRKKHMLRTCTAGIPLEARQLKSLSRWIRWGIALLLDKIQQSIRKLHPMPAYPK